MPSKKSSSWAKPRMCGVCERIHNCANEAKVNFSGEAYCTWCGDLAPHLKPIVKIDGGVVLEARLSKKDQQFLAFGYVEHDKCCQLILPSGKVVVFSSRDEFICARRQFRQNIQDAAAAKSKTKTAGQRRYAAEIGRHGWS